ncbi:terminase gpA endonuclease subunit [Massilia sp. UYP32]|uniref:terminase gpA endonuclease subunit n=1 Tax=Massilia sp. UYP32 TaxID=1756386 RepID=UPI003D23F001
MPTSKLAVGTLTSGAAAVLAAWSEGWAPKLEVPAGVRFLTAAVDVQDDRLELKVKGYRGRKNPGSWRTRSTTGTWRRTMYSWRLTRCSSLGSKSRAAAPWASTPRWSISATRKIFHKAITILLRCAVKTVLLGHYFPQSNSCPTRTLFRLQQDTVMKTVLLGHFFPHSNNCPLGPFPRKLS